MTRVYAIDGVVPVVHPQAFVHHTAVLIGDVVVGPDCYIGPSACLRGDLGQIAVGQGSSVQDNCTIHTFAGGEVVVGGMCNIGHGAVLHGCRLGERVLVGMNAVVMDGVEVGDDALVAALAFVPAAAEIPPGALVAGIPATVKRDLTAKEKQWKAEGSTEYLALTKRSRASMELVEPLDALPAPGPRLNLEGAKPLYLARAKG